jgi:hypothetical protein
LTLATWSIGFDRFSAFEKGDMFANGIVEENEEDFGEES